MLALARLLLDSGVVLAEEGPVGGIVESEDPVRTSLILFFDLDINLSHDFYLKLGIIYHMI